MRPETWNWRHGTETGWSQHQRLGERPCDPCFRAKAAADKRRREASDDLRRKARLNAKAQNRAKTELVRRYRDEYLTLYRGFKDDIYAEFRMNRQECRRTYLSNAARITSDSDSLRDAATSRARSQSESATRTFRRRVCVSGGISGSLLKPQATRPCRPSRSLSTCWGQGSRTTVRLGRTSTTCHQKWLSLTEARSCHRPSVSGICPRHEVGDAREHVTRSVSVGHRPTIGRLRVENHAVLVLGRGDCVGVCHAVTVPTHVGTRKPTSQLSRRAA